MKATFNRLELLGGLIATNKVISSRQPKPILSCVRISAGDKGVELFATNLERAMQYQLVQVEAGEVGDICVQGDHLLTIVKGMTGDTLVMELAKEMLVVKSDNATMKFYTQPAADMPPVPTPEGKPITLKTEELGRIISQTKFAIAEASTRYAFGGLFLKAEKFKLQAIATDGRRLAFAETAILANEEISAIVPTSAIEALPAILVPEQDVVIRIGNNGISFGCDGAVIFGSLVEGSFPPWEKYANIVGTRRMSCATEELLSVVRQVAAMSDETAKGSRLSLDKKGLAVSVATAARGEADVRLPCKFDGEPLAIYVNEKFLLEAIAAAGLDHMTIEFTESNRPMVLKNGRDWFSVLMSSNVD